jgi:phage terminase small subunit
MKRLTLLQQRFCDILLLMELAGQVHQGRAYKLAGYKCRGKTAVEEASRTLKKPQVKAYLARARAQMSQKVTKSDGEIIAEIEKLAYTNLTDLLSYDNKGVNLIPSKNLSEPARAALRAIKMKETQYRNKKGKIGKIKTVSVQLHNKAGSLDTLAKIRGLTNKPIEFKEPVPVQIVRFTRTCGDASAGNDTK